jgi:hypothetical protein
MRWRLVVRHLFAPIPAVFVGVVAGIGGTLVALGWLTRWYALRLVEPTPVTPEAWAKQGQEDVRTVLVRSLQHRIILNFEGVASGIAPRDIVANVLEVTPEDPARAEVSASASSWGS